MSITTCTRRLSLAHGCWITELCVCEKVLLLTSNHIQSWESPPISNITFHIFVWIVTTNQTPRKVGTSTKNWKLRTGEWNLPWWLKYSCNLICTDVGGSVSVWWCVDHLRGRFLFHFICIPNEDHILNWLSSQYSHFAVGWMTKGQGKHWFSSLYYPTYCGAHSAFYWVVNGVYQLENEDDLGGTQSWSIHFKEEKNSFIVMGIEPHLLTCPGHSQITIFSMLSIVRLPHIYHKEGILHLLTINKTKEL